jgi:hypothetical protein
MSADYNTAAAIEHTEQVINLYKAGIITLDEARDEIDHNPILVITLTEEFKKNHENANKGEAQ